MGVIYEKARYELDRAGHFDEDTFYGGLVGEAVMELIEVFEKQGHSGMSAPLIVSIFKQVALQKPLTPLDGSDDEWSKSSEDDTYQNRRNSAVFKQGPHGKPYFVDAIIWRHPNGGCFTGTVEGVKSRQYFDGFPFMPKSFYIDVDEAGEKILDKDQLAKVNDYYIKP